MCCWSRTGRGSERYEAQPGGCAARLLTEPAEITHLVVIPAHAGMDNLNHPACGRQVASSAACSRPACSRQVGSGGIGLGSDVFEAELFASGGEGVRGITRPIASAGSATVSVMTRLTVTPRRLPAAGRSVVGEGGFQVGDGAVRQAHRPLCCFWSGKTPAWMQVVEPRLEQVAEGVERRLEQAAERRAGSAGSRSLRRDRPARFSTRLRLLSPPKQRWSVSESNRGGRHADRLGDVPACSRQVSR